MVQTKSKGGLIRALLALVFTLTLLCSVVMPAASAYAASGDKLNVMVMSDTHVLAPALVGNTQDFKDVTTSNRKMFKESAGILDAQLNEVKKKKPDVLLLCGDLTKDGELESHRYMESRLQNLKKQLPNLKIYVTNGNHDINNKNAKNYNTGGKAVNATRTSPENFRDNYSVTYQDKSVIARYMPASGKSGMLSYVARPKAGFTFIVIDTGRYSADNTSNGKDEHQTSGQISSALENWVLKQIDDAKRRGDVVIGMEHHNIVPHFSWEPIIRSEFLINNYSKLSTDYADEGMHFMFSGHMHSQDIASKTTSKGNKFYDIETGSGINYATPMRDVSITRTRSNGKTSASLSGKTIEGEKVTYTDPTDGKKKEIPNIKTYGKSQIISKSLAKMLARKDLSNGMKAAGKKYNGSDYASKVNSIMDACMKIKVCDDGSKNLYDYVSYAYVHYLAGEDSGTKPDWFKQAEKRLKSGYLLSECLYNVSGQLKGFDQGRAMNICQYLFFPNQYVSRYGLSASSLASTTLAIANQGLDAMSDSTFKSLNQFYTDLITSISYDSNYSNDKTFTMSSKI